MLVPRPTYLQKLEKLANKQIIKVLTGVRRCGKSSLLQLFQQQLLADGVQPEQIQAINFEDLAFSKLTDYQELYRYLSQRLLPDQMNYIFLDEIQNVPNFEKAVDSLFIKSNVDLYITGSNAFMLSGELATLLSGRYIEIPVYPLSFKEFAQAKPDQSLQESYQQYLLRGGFPFALQLPDDESFRDYIDGVVNTVLVKDVLARKDKSDSTLVRRLAAFLTETAGSLTSPKKIADTLTSMGEKTTPNTVASYLELLENAFLFYRCDRFDIGGKKYLSINPKYYPVDISLRRALVGQKRPNKGSRLETIVYQELRRRGYEIYVGVMQQTEVDFVVAKDGRREYYQVSLSLDDEQTYQREVRSLRLIDDNYPKIILTEDPGHFDDQGISQVNIIDWLMGEWIWK